jgi:hypothetical protein
MREADIAEHADVGADIAKVPFGIKPDRKTA